MFIMKGGHRILWRMCGAINLRLRAVSSRLRKTTAPIAPFHCSGECNSNVERVGTYALLQTRRPPAVFWPGCIY